jgi:cytochrome c-type biogenesis protein CcmH
VARAEAHVKVGALVVAGLLAVTGAAAAASPAPPPSHDAPAAGEAVLMARLLAPCCYTQTLDVHESPDAAALRAEVRGRLRSGESAASIESDFVARYGERVRALPAGHDPRVALGLVSAALVASAGAFMARAVWRWRRAASAAAASPARRDAVPLEQTASRDAYDARIDEELRELR